MALAIPRTVAPRLQRWRLALSKAAAGLLDRAQASSKLVRARAGYAAGVAISAWGVGVEFGFGWALIVGGAVTAVSFLVLYPVDDKP